jgi:hypothetical protein
MSDFHTKNIHKSLKYKFHNSENIETNYSQTFQDMFALTILDGKENGTFLDIGCHHPQFHNNTYLLESLYNWNGFGIDLNKDILNEYKNNRKAEAKCADAVRFDYSEILCKFDLIDYLSLDIDPPHQSLAVLYKIFEYKKFIKVITFEHDAYIAGDKVREESRNFLQENYDLIVPNVTTSSGKCYEDWWCHKSLDIGSKFSNCKTKEKNMPSEFFYMMSFNF